MQDKPLNLRPGVLAWWLAPALACTLVLGACGGNGGDAAGASASAKPASAAEAAHEESGPLRLSDEERERAKITLETLAAAPVVDQLAVTATIRANQDRMVRVAPRVEGRVTAVTARLGDVVRAGQALATLDSPAIGEAAVAWLQARSAHRVALADFKRAQALDAEEIIPKREFLRAQSEQEKAQAALRAAEDRLRLLGVPTASLESAARQERVDSVFAVTAPFAGTVVEQHAALGQQASPAEPLYVLADLSRVWIEADLTEAVLARVRIGAEAEVSTEAYPGVLFKGRVTYIAAVLDKDKRTIPARIEVDNRDGRLKPEMFATARIRAGGSAHPDALSVPESAVLLLQGMPTVFVQDKDGFEPRAIETGERQGGRILVKSGLQAGEQIVATGAYALKARLLKSQIGDEH